MCTQMCSSFFYQKSKKMLTALKVPFSSIICLSLSDLYLPKNIVSSSPLLNGFRVSHFSTSCSRNGSNTHMKATFTSMPSRLILSIKTTCCFKAGNWLVLFSHFDISFILLSVALDDSMRALLVVRKKYLLALLLNEMKKNPINALVTIKFYRVI